MLGARARAKRFRSCSERRPQELGVWLCGAAVAFRSASNGSPDASDLTAFEFISVCFPLDLPRRREPTIVVVKICSSSRAEAAPTAPSLAGSMACMSPEELLLPYAAVPEPADVSSATFLCRRDLIRQHTITPPVAISSDTTIAATAEVASRVKSADRYGG